jgi:hypothetical protein
MTREPISKKDTFKISKFTVSCLFSCLRHNWCIELHVLKEKCPFAHARRTHVYLISDDAERHQFTHPTCLVDHWRFGFLRTYYLYFHL